VRVVRGGPATDLPDVDTGLSADWLQGPASSPGSIDVGVMTFAPGATTPLHMHREGQVLVVTAGEGFVEAGGERVEIGPGDVVLAAPGEWHVHGAAAAVGLVHVSVTTGTHEVEGTT
jgi:quercetin dioxygenase-like cupin family protein